MGRLILVRHGETNKNLGNRLHEENDVETLNDTGIRQIGKLANSLENSSISKIYSSTEPRAIESAAIMGNVLKLPVEKISGMQERNWGSFTDKPWSEVKIILDPMSLEERYLYTPPGGESWQTFESRLVDAIKKLTSENKQDTIIVVTHGGTIRALMPYLLNVSKEESFKYDPHNASVTIFDFDDSGFHQIAIDDTSHLQEG